MFKYNTQFLCSGVLILNASGHDSFRSIYVFYFEIVAVPKFAVLKLGCSTEHSQFSTACPRSGVLNTILTPRFNKLLLLLSPVHYVHLL